VGLVLLPAFYWGLDLIWHVFWSESPLLLLANLAIPVGVSLSALLCWTLWGDKLSECASLGKLSPSAIVGLSTFLGIYVSGPSFMLLEARVLQGHLGSSEQILSTWFIGTLLFPLTTLDFSTYDATLPAPFLTWLGVWLAGRIHARRLN
jgi:hypothetical protein